MPLKAPAGRIAGHAQLRRIEGHHLHAEVAQEVIDQQIRRFADALLQDEGDFQNGPSRDEAGVHHFQLLHQRQRRCLAGHHRDNR
jgi:hypothetical protein